MDSRARAAPAGLARRCFAAALLALLAASALAQSADAPNGLLLIAKPALLDSNFRQTVVLVTQTPDFSTVGVILNRPTSIRHERTGEPLYSGGPVMPQTLVALFRSDSAPLAPSFHVLQGIYLSMHPAILERLSAPYRMYAGFAGWMPLQLESEIQRDGWYVLPAREELLFRKDTSGMWEELVERARGQRTRSENVTDVAIRR
jgi:putative transcriptional regulator